MTIVERIELQYDQDINLTGMGWRTTRSYVAPATWTLINDILNRKWPPENGSLTKSTSALTYTPGELEFDSWYKMIAMIEYGLDRTPIITHRFAAEDFAQGFDTMRSGFSGKVVLDWS